MCAIECRTALRQVETLRQINFMKTRPPQAAAPARVAASPLLNCDDIPEVAFKGRAKAFGGSRRGQVRHKHQAGCFQTVFEVNDEDEDWPEIGQRDWQETDQQFRADVQWLCAFCTFMNASALPVCEMCERPRVPPVPDVAAHAICELVVREPAACEVSATGGSDAQPTVTFVGARKWPSLMQAAEKSWDLCSQSSMASSIVDVAILADLDGADKDGPLALEAIAPIEVRPSELFDNFSETGSQRGGADCGDASSVTSSWCHVAACEDDEAQSHGDNASVASSWIAVGDLADIEAKPWETTKTSSKLCWLEVAAPFDLEGKPVESLNDVCDSSVSKQNHPAWKRCPGVATWSAVASASGNGCKLEAPSLSGVPVPPLVRRQAPPKKKAALEVDDQVFFDDQDGRGQGRCNRSYRRRR